VAWCIFDEHSHSPLLVYPADYHLRGISHPLDEFFIALRHLPMVKGFLLPQKSSEGGSVLSQDESLFTLGACF